MPEVIAKGPSPEPHDTSIAAAKHAQLPTPGQFNSVTPSSTPSSRCSHRPQWSFELSSDQLLGCSLPVSPWSPAAVTRRQPVRSGLLRFLLTNLSFPIVELRSRPPTLSSITLPLPRPLLSTPHSSSSLPTMLDAPPLLVSVTLPGLPLRLPSRASSLPQPDTLAETPTTT